MLDIKKEIALAIKNDDWLGFLFLYVSEDNFPECKCRDTNLDIATRLNAGITRMEQIKKETAEYAAIVLDVICSRNDIAGLHYILKRFSPGTNQLKDLHDTCVFNGNQSLHDLLVSIIDNDRNQSEVPDSASTATKASNTDSREMFLRAVTYIESNAPHHLLKTIESNQITMSAWGYCLSSPHNTQLVSVLMF